MNQESKQKKLLLLGGSPQQLIAIQKAKELGYSIKVETRGAGGAKNVLTADEIERADGIIVAADTQVPMDRFQGKPIVVTKVADGINKPEELLREIVDGKAPLYEGGGETAPKEETAEKEGIGHATYKHLMSGVSHMLPFVIGGGIMIVGFLFGYNPPKAILGPVM